MSRTAAFFLALTLLIGHQTSAQAPYPTWADDVQCILYTHCAPCHNPDGIGPFSVIDYATAKAYAPLITYRTQLDEMPPWKPNPAHNRFVGERFLTEEEKETLRKWDLIGAPLGDTTKNNLPEPFYGETEADDHELVVKMTEYSIPDITKDIVVCFPEPTGLDTLIFATETEFVPGDREAVHHAFALIDKTSIPHILDSLDPGPGYDCYGGTGSQNQVLMSYAPGTSRIKLPPVGHRLFDIPCILQLLLQGHH